MRFWTSKTRGIGTAGENSILFLIITMTSNGLGMCGMVETALKRKGIEVEQMRISRGGLIKSILGRLQSMLAKLTLQRLRFHGGLPP
jgi:hypothetical protein